MTQKIKLNIDVNGINEIKAQVNKLCELISQIEVEIEKLSEMQITIDLGDSELKE